MRRGPSLLAFLLFHAPLQAGQKEPRPVPIANCVTGLSPIPVVSSKASEPLPQAITPVPSRTPRLDRVSLRKRAHYKRPADQALHSLPQWYIVFSYEQYAQFIAKHPPSQFPYLESIVQFWETYDAVYEDTSSRSSINRHHIMNGVIGAGFTIEYGLKWLHEKAIGQFIEEKGKRRSGEDRYIANLASHYVRFIRVLPWYEFSFLDKVPTLWKLQSPRGSSPIRQWERRIAFTIELLLKAAWAQAITFASEFTYEPRVMTIEAVTNRFTFSDPRVKVLAEVGKGSLLIEIPRYQLFSEILPLMVKAGVEFREIAGNKSLLVTFRAPSDWVDIKQITTMFHAWPVLTEAESKRVALIVALPELHAVLTAFEKEGLVEVDHIFD